jgi:hypothetical protein
MPGKLAVALDADAYCSGPSDLQSHLRDPALRVAMAAVSLNRHEAGVISKEPISKAFFEC